MEKGDEILVRTNGLSPTGRIPHAEDPAVQVLLDGLDVFRAPADEILAHATRKGWHVDDG
ncbi:hypothetical protein [Streptomyces globisporus]|uniref:hypothetical protein n=1 Tax=Streptomyces globisporus TaxID=1908 RepID=UPI0004C72C58|nr:hypothetical protein [Streptomyces globisporus]